MLQTFLQGHAMFRVTHKQPRNEILSVVGEMTGELEIDIDNFLVGVLPAFLRFEWCVTCAQLITENPDTPYIHQMIVVVTNNDLRRYVIQCSTECYSFPT